MLCAGTGRPVVSHVELVQDETHAFAEGKELNCPCPNKRTNSSQWLLGANNSSVTKPLESYSSASG